LVALTAGPPDPSPDLPIYYAPKEGLAFDPDQPQGKARLVPIEAKSSTRPSPLTLRLPAAIKEGVR